MGRCWDTLPRLGGMRRRWAESLKLDSSRAGLIPPFSAVKEFDQNMLRDWCRCWKPTQVSASHARD